MSIAEKFEVITDAVYEKGKKDEHDKFWDEIQNYGNRTEYLYAFSRWGSEYIRPKYKVIPTDVNSGNQPFSYCPKLKKVESKYFDFSQKVKGTSTNNQTGWYYTFTAGSKLEEIEDIKMQPEYMYQSTFASCPKLHTIAVLRTDAYTKYSNTFKYSGELQNLTVEGTIGQNGFNVQWSTKLTVKSLLSILTALSKDKSIASGKTVTFADNHLAVIQADEDCLEQLSSASTAGWSIFFGTTEYEG